MKHWNRAFYANLLCAPDDGTKGGGGDPKPADGEGKETKVTFTDEQQKFIDELLDKRVATIRTKAETEAAEKIRKEQEAAELAKLQGEEKLKKEREIFEAERKTFEARTRQLEADGLLAKAGLIIEGADETTKNALLGFVTGENAETTQKNIDALKKLVDALAQKGVEGKLKESAGGFKGNPGNEGEDLSKLSDEEYYARLEAKKKSK